MIISCPQCDTSFFMPDELYKPGRKARCSQCGFVFRLPSMEELHAGFAEDAAPEILPIPEVKPSSPAVETKGKSSKRRVIFIALAVLICLVVIGSVGIFVVSNFMGDKETTTTAKPVETEAELRERMEREARIQGIRLEDVRQFTVVNDHMKNIVVIQGMAVNDGNAAKEFIRVEGRLLDAEQKVLASIVQLCGTSLTQFQLKVLTYKEMQEALNNKITILTNNVDLAKGAKVPFMIVFQTQPATLKSFSARVVDAVLSKTTESGQNATPAKP